VQSALEDEVGAVLRLEVLLDEFDVVLPRRAAALRRHQVEARFAYTLGLLGLERAGVHHTDEDGGAPADRGIRVLER